jgi:tryptophan synthase beta chain
MGKGRIVAETGAGQHGVATATACAKLGLSSVIYMGAVDAERQAPNVQRMKLLGADFRLVTRGSQTLKDAINEAMGDWITNVEDTHYLLGSAVGPHPFPSIVAHFQSIIGQESRRYFQDKIGRLPDLVVACVGGGSNAIGMFKPFVDDASVRLVGVQAGGTDFGEGHHSSPLLKGRPGILHGCVSKLLQNEDGQILPTHSIAPGLDYPAVGPEHCHLQDIGRAEYVSVNDDECLNAFQSLCALEGILPALESAHGLAYIIKVAPSMSKDKTILLNLSGRGDKDLSSAMRAIEERVGRYE